MPSQSPAAVNQTQRGDAEDGKCHRQTHMCKLQWTVQMPPSLLQSRSLVPYSSSPSRTMSSSLHGHSCQFSRGQVSDMLLLWNQLSGNKDEHLLGAEYMTWVVWFRSKRTREHWCWAVLNLNHKLRCLHLKMNHRIIFSDEEREGREGRLWGG